MKRSLLLASGSTLLLLPAVDVVREYRAGNDVDGVAVFAALCGACMSQVGYIAALYLVVQ